MDAEKDTVTTLGNLGTTVHIPDEVLAFVEKFICQLYQPGTDISQVKELRWHMFRKNQAESDRLPTTQGHSRFPLSNDSLEQ